MAKIKKITSQKKITTKGNKKSQTPFKSPSKTAANKPKTTANKKFKLPFSAEESQNDVNKINGAKEQEIKVPLQNPSLQNLRLDQDQVRKGVKALLELDTKTKEKKNKPELFDENSPVFLQVTCIKVPQTPTRIVRLGLENSLYNNESEICLIVSDLKNKKVKEHEEAIEFYENLLRQKGVTNIKTIMPLNQLRTEYNTFESKRRLVELHDVFLVEGKISGQVHHLLGKTFITKRKIPTSVKLHVTNVKGQIDNALNKSCMHVHSKGDSFITQIGNTNMDVEKITENIVSASRDLAKEFPGGWDNIEGLYIKTHNSMGILVYITLKNKNQVEVPVIEPKRPKAFQTVTEELSTYENATVTVFPSGAVRVNMENVSKKSTKGQKKTDENENTKRKIQSDVDKKTEKSKTSKKTKSKQKKTIKAANDGAKGATTAESFEPTDHSESDNDLEKEELAYLQNWQNEQKATVKSKQKENTKSAKKENVKQKQKKADKEQGKSASKANAAADKLSNVENKGGKTIKKQNAVNAKGKQKIAEIQQNESEQDKVGIKQKKKEQKQKKVKKEQNENVENAQQIQQNLTEKKENKVKKTQNKTKNIQNQNKKTELVNSASMQKSLKRKGSESLPSKPFKKKKNKKIIKVKLPSSSK